MSARITVEDIGQSLRDYAEDVEASPDRLAEVEDRLAAHRSLEAQVWANARRRDCAGRGTRAQAQRNGEQGRGAAQAARRSGESGGTVSRGCAQSLAASLRSSPQAGEAGRERSQRTGDEGALQGRGQRIGRGRELDLEWFRRGAVSDFGESGRTAGAGGGDRVGRRAVARDAGAEDDHRRGSVETSAAEWQPRAVPAADAGVR